MSSGTDPRGVLTSQSVVGPEDVLDFWFNGDMSASRGIWFKRDAAFDATCGRFADVCKEARRGLLFEWAETPRSALALVILLDQFSRNLFRDSAEAFTADPLALSLARLSISRGFDQLVPPAARQFFYLPFEHSEDLRDQEEGLRLFAALGDAEAHDYALRHREVIARFGRFPHRNAVLGRTSTWEETAYLAGQPAGF